jgi:hypothetical protein
MSAGTAQGNASFSNKRDSKGRAKRRSSGGLEQGRIRHSGRILNSHGKGTTHSCKCGTRGRGRGCLCRSSSTSRCPCRWRNRHRTLKIVKKRRRVQNTVESQFNARGNAAVKRPQAPQSSTLLKAESKRADGSIANGKQNKHEGRNK